MRWNKFTLKTRSEVEDIVISTLAEAGVEGVEIEDKVPLTEQDKQQMFVDILPDGPADDGIAYLNFYLDEKEDKEELLANVKDALEELRMFVDIGEGTITESQTEDKDWINNWKQYFHQFYVDDILIIPSWEEVKPEDKDKMIIHIDPGTAFGTGMHETTQLCMRQLKKYVKDGMEILDVGTGSGILSIAALKLGAGHAVGTDLDPCAISATRENLEANQIPEGSMDVMIGNIIDDKAVQDQVGYEKYDIVTANILADVLIPLTPVICHQMKPGALYITSGILDVKEDVVVKAVKDAGGRLNHKRFYAQTRRIWLKSLWWYVFLSWQGSELKTYNALKNNKTDNINKLIETPGRGYRLMLYRAMIAEYAKYSALNKTSTKEFAAFTKLNNAKCVNVEPALTPGGEKGYAHRLFEELRESGGDENDTSRGNPQ